MLEKISSIEKKLHLEKVKRANLEASIQDLGDQHQYLESRQANAWKAHAIIQEVALRTQQNLEFHLSNPVTLALKAVNPEWPEFKARISIRRGKTECDLLFCENGNEQHPMDSSGGGPKDIASFALRIAYWSLKRNRRTFVLDEPFRNVSPDLQEVTSEMVKMISEKLGIQIIMISHQDDINVAADRTFLNVKKGQRSTVEVIS